MSIQQYSYQEENTQWVPMGAETCDHNLPADWPAADGDLAPLTVYGGFVNAGDVLVAARMALAVMPKDAVPIAHGDLTTSGASAVIIDSADVALLIQQVPNSP